ncbi:MULTISPECIES: hypothetical protein [Clostridia]|jgi:hypothetical protein|uniref:hypothetical protein n=1 Tax=Clostridia TaxID=186801 RepID=UPI00041DD852|nr:MULTISPECIES: hypothetical protein [Clostridia]MDI3537943.1 hypothetical protein [Eubacteriaceae bacterium]
MNKFENKRWKEISEEDKVKLLKDAVCRDFVMGSPLLDGEGIVDFYETLAATGRISNGVIEINDDEVLYNPCIGNDGQPISQEELDSMFEKYKSSEPDDLEDKVHQFEKYYKSRPHVVLLGAGASVATILNGDKNGKKISAMKGFIDKLGMQSIISSINLKTTSDNLEDIYMEMYERGDCELQRIQLEDAIEKYFCDFELPDEPTIYDYLLLSLTKKDLVATFNWDPLLVEAYSRCTRITDNLPQMAFLHGNIAVATCEEDMVLGSPYAVCSKCGRMLKRVPLLYPIREKNYDENPYISMSWKQLGQYLESAYRLTIFGYSAPKSDQAAIDMLKKAWGAVDDRNLEEIEIIDIRSEEEVIQSWEEFIHTHHYSVWNDFFNSALGKFPRRTCELLFDNTQNNRWIHGNRGFKKGMSFDALTSYLKDLLQDESTGKEILSDPYI